MLHFTFVLEIVQMDYEFGILPTVSIKDGLYGVEAASKFNPFNHQSVEEFIDLIICQPKYLTKRLINFVRRAHLMILDTLVLDFIPRPSVLQLRTPLLKILCEETKHEIIPSGALIQDVLIHVSSYMLTELADIEDKLPSTVIEKTQVSSLSCYAVLRFYFSYDIKYAKHGS